MKLFLVKFSLLGVTAIVSLELRRPGAEQLFGDRGEKFSELPLPPSSHWLFPPSASSF